MITKLFFFFAFLTLSTGYPYNDHEYFGDGLKNPYPDTCCQLEWTDILQGDPLPKDYVNAGKFMDREWAFVGTKSGRIAVKSDQAMEEPNWMGGQEVYPYPILTNPNKCFVGWYRTRLNQEEIVSLPFQITSLNQEWFFPPLSTNGDVSFGQYKGAPAYYRLQTNGGIATLSSLKESNFDWLVDGENHDLLYVDCKKSILSMSKADIKFKYTSGKIASQSWITQAIERGSSGQALCKNITHYMNINHGNYWNCFAKARNLVYFNLDGVDWVVFQGKQ